MQYPVTIKQKDGTEKTFWLSDEKLQFGGTDSGVTDVKVNGTSIVDGGVANVPVATDAGAYGMVKFSGSNPLYLDSNNELSVYAAAENNINARNTRRPITPTNLDYAVKAALTDARKIAYTDAEKASARATIGAISSDDIPYVAGGGVPGISAVTSTYGMQVIPNTHYIAPSRALNEQIDAKTHLYAPITPYNLDYAVKASLSHSTVEWTDAETAAARDVLGVGLATATTPGLVRPWNEGGGIMMDSDGVIKIYAADPERIDARIQRYAPITPYRLNYAVKAALTDANKMTMTAAEQASACQTIGAVPFNPTLEIDTVIDFDGEDGKNKPYMVRTDKPIIVAEVLIDRQNVTSEKRGSIYFAIGDKSLGDGDDYTFSTPYISANALFTYFKATRYISNESPSTAIGNASDTYGVSGVPCNVLVNRPVTWFEGTDNRVFNLIRIPMKYTGERAYVKVWTV